MRLRTFVLVLPAALLALPAWGQAPGPADEPLRDPDFAGRVFESPVPVPKIDPVEEEPVVILPPETTEGGTDTATGTGPDADDPDAGTSGSGIETRPLPVVLRPGEPPSTDLDAGGRIKSAPPADAEPGERTDSRFVRAPEGTYEPESSVAALGVPIESPETDLRRGAKLRQLDKMTGGIVTFDIAVGETLEVARLKVKLDACRSPGDNDTHGTMAHLEIWDTKTPDAPPAFAGWMFAESPALSALDHPRYDVWVISCTTLAGDTSAGNE